MRARVPTIGTEHWILLGLVFLGSLAAVLEAGKNQGLFVLQVLRVPQVPQWHETEHDRHLVGWVDRLEESLEGVKVVDRRRHQEVRAGCQLAARRGDFVGEITGGRGAPWPDLAAAGAAGAADGGVCPKASWDMNTVAHSAAVEILIMGFAGFI